MDESEERCDDTNRRIRESHKIDIIRLILPPPPSLLSEFSRFISDINVNPPFSVGSLLVHVCLSVHMMRGIFIFLFFFHHKLI
jgi:hypothetical protein